MKKHLLFLSALGMAGAACAQSSVTLFGIVDATLARGTGAIADRTQLTRGGYNSNRLGFRGVEDLGGGMSAGFWLEAGLSVDDGTALATNSNNQASGAAGPLAGSQGLTFGRRATVSLTAPWGEIRLGRDYVPQYWNMLFGDPFGNVGAGAAVNYTAIITGVTSTRASNSIAYFTPGTLGGFGANLMHHRGENASGAATSEDGNGTGIRMWYGAGPFMVSGAWARTKYAAGDVEQRNINGSWDFGVAKVMATYNSDRAGTLSAKGGAVGVSAPVGVGEVKAAYSFHKTDAAGTPKARKLALGYVHNLSKRTALYSTFARLSNSGGAAFALNGAVTGPDASSNGFDVGIRHSF